MEEKRNQPIQRWLSLTGICDQLQTSPEHIRWLVNNGYLENIPGKRKNFETGRFLDPTPEYTERLRIAEMIYGRRQKLPSDIDIPAKQIFTRAEIAALMDWSDAYAIKALRLARIPFTKTGPGRNALKLYSAKAVRELMWKRNGRKMAKQRAPYLLPELVDWLRNHISETSENIPTDKMFAEDDKMRRRLEFIMKMPIEDRISALDELMGKVALGRAVVSALNASSAASR